MSSFRLVLLSAVGLAALALLGFSLWTLRAPLRSAWQLWRAAPTSRSTLTFAVVGDNHGVNPIYRQILRELPGQRPSFLLNLADTSERGATEEFQQVKETESILPFPVYHVVGSHDIKTDPTRRGFIDVFGRASWWSLDVGPLHLVIMDNADRQVGFPAASLDWLEEDLRQYQDQTVIVAYHRPFNLPFSKLLGDDETSASRQTNDRFVKLLQRYRVAYVLTAHVHTYLPYTLGGIPAVVSGGGGDPAQTILGGPKNNYFHYLTVTVEGKNVSVTPHRVSLVN